LFIPQLTPVHISDQPYSVSSNDGHISGDDKMTARQQTNSTMRLLRKGEESRTEATMTAATWAMTRQDNNCGNVGNVLYLSYCILLFNISNSSITVILP